MSQATDESRSAGSYDKTDVSSRENVTIKARRKKKKKRPKTPMPFVTARDSDIFKILSSGVHTAAHIKHELRKFVAKNPKAADDKGDGFKRDISMRALRNRLYVLKKGNYIRSKLYPDAHGKGIYAGFVLGPAGKDYLIEKLNYKGKHIRDNLPSRDHMAHEAQVVSIVETVKREGNRLGYGYDIEDENYLKRESGGAKKKMPYPDLHVTMAFRTEKEIQRRQLAIELDNGRQPAMSVAEKAFRTYEMRKWLTIILCPNPARIDKLRAALARYIEKEMPATKDPRKRVELEKLALRVFFATTYEFIENAFLNTAWLMVGERKAVFVPGNYSAKELTKINI